MDKLIPRLIELLNGRHCDDMIYWVLLECDLDPNTAAHQLLDQDQASMKKRPLLNQGASSSQSNLSEDYKKCREDEELLQYPTNVMISLLGMDFRELREKTSVAALVRSSPILEASDRTSVGHQPSRNRQSTPSETKEANDWVNSIFNESLEGDSETASRQSYELAASSTNLVFPSGHSSELAAPSTNPVFPFHETDRVSDPQALPDWNLPSTESDLMRVSDSANFTLPTDDISWSSASSSALAVHGNEVVPPYIGGNNLNLQQNIPQQFRGFFKNLPSQPALSQSPLSKAIYGDLSLPEYGGGNDFLACWRRPRKKFNVAGNNTQFSLGSSSSTTGLTSLQHNIPQQFRAFPNYPSSSAIPGEGIVSQYIRRQEDIKLQNLLHPPNNQDSNSRSTNERRVSRTSQGQRGRCPTAQQPLQMNQQHERRDPTAQQPLQMNQQHVQRDPTAQQPLQQQHVQRDPTNSSQFIPQEFLDLLFSDD